MMNEKTYKGYDLFTDLEDQELRNRNRAVILANVAEDNTVNSLLTAKGVSIIMGYFHRIPDHEKGDVEKRFRANLKERGYAVA